jgi:hypothetical protein
MSVGLSYSVSVDCGASMSINRSANVALVSGVCENYSSVVNAPRVGSGLGYNVSIRLSHYVGCYCGTSVG